MLVIGAGRVATITTETIAIASGNKPNIISIYMLLQALLPFLAFLIASVLAYRIRGGFDATNH
ncbi:MAG: putative thiamine transport system permease protein [Arenicella sp.]|jgi:putative thiamine transport system permease protein